MEKLKRKWPNFKQKLKTWKIQTGKNEGSFSRNINSDKQT